MRVKLIAKTVVFDVIPGYVEHLDDENYPTDADDLADQAGRLCYLSWNRPNPETATNKGYLENIQKQEHNSVMEHASATFYIDGVTRNFTHELIRHRHHSFSEVSQRYVPVDEFEFIDHPGLEAIGTATRYMKDKSVEKAKEAYGVIMFDLNQKGVKGKKARQAARHILPSGLETRILVTGNMQAWRYVMGKRLSPTADEEFRRVAALILSELKTIAPNTFQDFE